MDKKYLVVSYDSDQQQWFYDTVLAKDEESAGAFVCEMRPYVQDADATETGEVAAMAQRIAAKDDADVQAEMEAMRLQHVEEEG